MGQRPFLAPFPIGVDALDIAEVRRALERIVGHAQLFALIDIRGALQHMKTGGQHFGGSLSELRAVVAKAGDRAGLVMVMPEKAVPCRAVQLCLPAGQGLFQGGEGQLFICPLTVFAVAFDVLELEYHIELAGILAGVLFCRLCGYACRLADCHDIIFR